MPRKYKKDMNVLDALEKATSEVYNKVDEAEAATEPAPEAKEEKPVEPEAQVEVAQFEGTPEQEGDFRGAGGYVYRKEGDKVRIVVDPSGRATNALLDSGAAYDAIMKEMGTAPVLGMDKEMGETTISPRTTADEPTVITGKRPTPIEQSMAQSSDLPDPNREADALERRYAELLALLEEDKKRTRAAREEAADEARAFGRTAGSRMTLL